MSRFSLSRGSRAPRRASGLYQPRRSQGDHVAAAPLPARRMLEPTGTPTSPGRLRTVKVAASFVTLALVATLIGVGSPADAKTTYRATVKASGVTPTGAKAKELLGSTRSGLPWHSGVWVGGRFSNATVAQFGQLRGRQADMVTTYSDPQSFRTLADSTWSIRVWNGFGGKLNYGLSILPDSGEGSLASVANGDQDWVWRSVAKNLKNAGRGDSVVRLAWESNLKDWRWYANSGNAEQYKAAFRRVATVLKSTAPGLKIDFGIGCGSGLAGSSDRMAPLTKLYPGDKYVDIVSCDIYDWWGTKVTGSSRDPIARPTYGPGLADLARFARQHDKGVGIGEWGLATAANGGGGGDNPAFMKAMFTWMTRNVDVLAYECYFDEPASYLQSSIMSQNGGAAAAYRGMW